MTRALLAYNERNLAADGYHEPNNVGPVLDLSHCGLRSLLEVMELSDRSPIFSHSNARSLFEHERNITDEQIKACAAHGGWVGINGVGFFLAEGPCDIVENMSRHLAYMANLVGAEHLGLGLDCVYLEGNDYGFYRRQPERWLRGYQLPPWDFFQPEDLGSLVLALEARGFSRAELRSLLGDNYLRVILPERISA